MPVSQLIGTENASRLASNEHLLSIMPPWSKRPSCQNFLACRSEPSGSKADAARMSRNRVNVLALTADWALGKPQEESLLARGSQTLRRAKVRIIEGEAANRLGQEEKWELLSPFLTQHGREGIAYATLQAGMEYFIGETGYIAYTRVQHPLIARKPKR